MSLFPFIKAPDPEFNFDVGDIVEVLCDHDKNGERIRGWLKGIVVQVDAKMVAVQFRTNIFLTDGWMVPDHILWFPQNSNNLRLPQRRSMRSSASKPD
jgi:5S rRNA maturation endonuclease (ribonuclease M5)